jgi:malonate-semialdehyde dehydrogenase (acetylating)/methylmalonate-semialdehyde dehydrogenase
MGPLVTSDHRKRVAGYIEKGVAEGATPLCDGRRYKSAHAYPVVSASHN